MTVDRRLILASASPRRADLLKMAGFSFDIAPVDVDERRQPSEEVHAYVLRLAAAKAIAAQSRDIDALVLAADTAVVIDGRILGKPGDDRDAADMLRRLSGRTHEVVTGITCRLGRRVVSHVETTRVRFVTLAEQEIEWYVATGEPRDKAGAYGVQGLASRFVDRIEGSYSNVVGLPIAPAYRLLKELLGS